MFKILILNNISPLGLEKFNTKKYLVSDDIKHPDAILLRSFDLHHWDIPDSLAIVGRAGVGVNNIPIQKFTELGVPVLNTPGANANAVKELVITGLLLASRHIFPAWDFTRQLSGDDQSLHEHVEKNKKRFSGFELPGKTLGVIGLGKVGVKVANAAVHLDMRVVGYDPAITVRSAWELSSDVSQCESLRDLLQQSNFVTLHVPLLESTHHLINEKNIGLMKPDAVLLNFARAEIVDNNAIIHALNKHHLRYYVSDFPSNVYKNHPNVICLPHLGASTKEAEENCAMMIVDQIIDYLENGQIRNSVNFPSVKLTRTEGHRMGVINANVPNMVAQISGVLSDAGINIIDMINKSRDEIAYTMFDINKPVDEALLSKIRAIKGVIRSQSISC